MRKTFLIRANVLLGTLSLLLAGCHTTKKAAASQSEAPAKQDEVGVANDRIVCMYGVPPQVYEQQRAKEEEEMRRQEQLRQDSLKNDSTATTRHDRVMLKYGVPYPRPEQQ